MDNKDIVRDALKCSAKWVGPPEEALLYKQALEALTHLTDKKALAEKLRGMIRPLPREPRDNRFYREVEASNTLLQTILKLIGEE